MAETFLLGEVKTRPGTYFRRERFGNMATAGANNGILAVLFQSNYGELNKVVDVSQSDLNNLEDLFGDGAAAIYEGLIGGATTIRAIRVGDDDGTASKVILKTTGTENIFADAEKTFTVTGGESSTIELGSVPYGDTLKLFEGETELEDYSYLGDHLTVPAFDDEENHTLKATWKTLTGTRNVDVDAVELSSKFVGDRTFTASIRTNLITDKRQLVVYDGTVVFASVSFEAGGDEAQSLVDALKNNRHFTARKLNSGVLNDVVQAQLTGGTNPTVTTASYSKGTEVLERYRWNCIVSDSDDSAINGILTAFVKQSYETGHLGFACIAGKSSQDLDARMSWAASCNDEKVVYVLNGWKGNTGIIYDGWRAAARIGGMVAASDTNASLTHAVISDALELIEPLTNGEIARAEEKGCLVLSLNSDDQVWIDSAINTLITPDANQDDGWCKIRRTKCRFELIQRVNDTCERLVGKVNNDSNGRATIMAAAQGIINEMCAEGKLFDGSYIEEDTRYTPEGDSAYFVLWISDIDSAEKLYLSYRFSYGNMFAET